jgi:hypothetical protein
MSTKFKHKCNILADIWLNYRSDAELDDFIEYNDLGLPLAYAIAEGIVESTPLAKTFVEETFDLLLSGLDMEEDTGFKNLDEIL